MAVRSLKNSGLQSSAIGSNSMLTGYSFQDFHHLETVQLGAIAASVTFTNLIQYSGEFRHLQLRVVNKSAGVNAQLFLTFNGDTGNNYSHHEVIGTGSAVESYGSASQPRIQLVQLPPTTGFTGGVVDILDAFDTTKFKTTRMFGGQAEGSFNQIRLGSGNWRNLNLINSVTLTGGASLAAGSRFSLYGIR